MKGRGTRGKQIRGVICMTRADTEVRRGKKKVWISVGKCLGKKKKKKFACTTGKWIMNRWTEWALTVFFYLDKGRKSNISSFSCISKPFVSTHVNLLNGQNKSTFTSLKNTKHATSFLILQRESKIQSRFHLYRQKMLKKIVLLLTEENYVYAKKHVL